MESNYRVRISFMIGLKDENRTESKINEIKPKADAVEHNSAAKHSKELHECKHTMLNTHHAHYKLIFHYINISY